MFMYTCVCAVNIYLCGAHVTRVLYILTKSHVLCLYQQMFYCVVKTCVPKLLFTEISVPAYCGVQHYLDTRLIYTLNN